MEIKDIIIQLLPIFTDILDNEDIALNEATTANDIEEWDSLNHIQLVVAIEKHFKMKFTAQEVQSWRNVGQMCQAIQQRMISR